jgi:hypothetical protein
MRYLMLVVGLLGVGLGTWVIVAGNPLAKPSGEFFVQVGALFLAVGLATVDIVEAMNARRL